MEARSGLHWLGILFLLFLGCLPSIASMIANCIKSRRIDTVGLARRMGNVPFLAIRRPSRNVVWTVMTVLRLRFVGNGVRFVRRIRIIRATFANR
jgi:hypothetical protein